MEGMMPDHTIAWESLEDWIKQGMELRATDIHLVPGYTPMARREGKLVPLNDIVLTREMTHWVYVCLFDNRGYSYGREYSGYAQLTRTYGDTIADISAASTGGARSIAIRLHGGTIPELDKSNVPVRVTELLNAPNGLILVAGPHGSGKTTTLYMLTEWINRNRAVHLCTVERPRHYLFQPRQAMIQQREVGLDGPTPASLIDAAMHQDLDVLMVGDIEDFDTLAGVLNAAQTGHLVLVQVHAKDAADAVQRIVGAAPEGMQGQVRRQLSECLRGVIVQRLARNKDGKHRVAVCDILGEGARKFVDGGKPDAGFYLARIQDEIRKLEQAGTIDKQEAERLQREVGS
jgi:twitching motility protein PilT